LSHMLRHGAIPPPPPPSTNTCAVRFTCLSATFLGRVCGLCVHQPTEEQ
jgi:hypothetical protein